MIVKITGSLSNGVIFELKGQEEGKEFEFITDEGIVPHFHFLYLSPSENQDKWFVPEQVVDGLDRAIQKMKKGEKSLIIVDPEYGFGSVETKGDLATIPPGSTLHFEVELVSFVKVLFSSLMLFLHLFFWLFSPISRPFFFVRNLSLRFFSWFLFFFPLHFPSTG